jgi:hypothetical protein
MTMIELDDLQAAGLEALKRLFPVAQRDTGQSRIVARFLLGLYNGYRFPYDLTDFRCLDDALFRDCMQVLRMDARDCKQEVHLYFKDGGQLWERMAADWGCVEVSMLCVIGRELVERDLLHHASEQQRQDYTEQLRRALRLST